MQYDDEYRLEGDVVTILACIYSKVKWASMGSRSSYDIFEHRIEYARHEQSIPEFIQRLCNKLNIQAPTYGKYERDFLDAVERCRGTEEQTLHMIRTRGKLLTLLAATRSRVMKMVTRDDKKEAELDDKIRKIEEGKSRKK